MRPTFYWTKSICFVPGNKTLFLQYGHETSASSFAFHKLTPITNSCIDRQKTIKCSHFHRLRQSNVHTYIDPKRLLDNTQYSTERTLSNLLLALFKTFTIIILESLFSLSTLATRVR